MAQDFGDEMGKSLIDFVSRTAADYLRRTFPFGQSAARDWWQEKYEEDGLSPEDAAKSAGAASERTQVIVPFASNEEAAYYAQVCRESGIYAAAYTDKGGAAFLAFAGDDAEAVSGLAPKFQQVMEAVNYRRTLDLLASAEAVDEETAKTLTEMKEYPALPTEDVTLIPVTIRYKDAPDETVDVLFAEQDTETLHIDEQVFFSGYTYEELTEMIGRDTREDFDVLAVGDPYKVRAVQVKGEVPEVSFDVPAHTGPSKTAPGMPLVDSDIQNHTKYILDAASIARDSCTSFSDFENKLHPYCIGVTVDKAGEVMLFQTDEENLLPGGGMPDYVQGRDWPVRATTLKENYNFDVTHAWFEQKKAAGNGMDTRQAALSHSVERDAPTATDGAMDNDGRTPDPNSGIESHDGGDTNTRTAVMDAEQTGSSVRPSDIVREEHASEASAYDLSSETRDMNASCKQLDTESHAAERDLSNLMQPSR